MTTFHWLTILVLGLQPQTHQAAIYKLCLWIQGRTFILIAQKQYSSQQWMQDWHKRFKELHITAAAYTREVFSAPNVTYLRVSIHRHQFYIGMTTVSIVKRERARLRKLRALSKGRLASCEPALRWWHKTHSYFDYCTIVLLQLPDKISTQAHEKAIIQRFQPQLNEPWIKEFFKHTATGTKSSWKPPCDKHTLSTRTLWKRVRDRCKLHSWLKHHSTAATFNTAQWTVLYKLASFSREAFVQERRLRSPTFHSDRLYVLMRCASHMEEPSKTRVINTIRRTMIYREVSVPKGCRNIVAPFLSHPDFKDNVQRWMKDFLHKFSEHCIPFHIPNAKLIECKHLSVGDKLFNWKNWYATFTMGGPTTCHCQKFCNQHPHTQTSDGHVASPADLCFAQNHTLKAILKGSSKNTFYPTKDRWMHRCMTSFKRWLSHHGMPRTCCENWHLMMQTQWDKHVQHLKEHPTTFQFRHMKVLHTGLDSMVVHNQDHDPTKFMLYCPILYYNLVQATFNDPQIFTKHEMSPADLHSNLQNMCPRRFTTRYKWGMKWDASLPYCYIFPKAKKNFTTARPVISFWKSPFSKLFKALGTVLYTIARMAYPNNLHTDDVHTTFKKLHHFFRILPDPAKYSMHNDDLIGFYTSVPQQRILQAIAHLLSTYLRKQPPGTKSPTFTVDIHQQDAQLRIFRGKTRKQSSNSYLIHFCDIQALVQFSLDMSYFISTGSVYSQVRGSCIGSPVSPALCNITVAYEEVMWQKTFEVQLHSMGFFTRYVDNRLSIIKTKLEVHSPLHTFLQLGFYGEPVTLEQVGDLHFLGFHIDLHNKKVSFIVPEAAHRYRSTHSAGSQSMALTGAISRLHTICRATFPRKDIPAMCTRLTQAYIAHGADPLVMKACQQKVLNQYRIGSKMHKVLSLLSAHTLRLSR